MRPRLLLSAAWLAVASVGLTGCNCYQVLDDFDDCTMGIRNKLSARSAWSRRSACYDGVPHAHYFKDGFLDGYTAVAEGGGQCPPSLPPRCYWGVRFQTPEGKACVNAWFEGHAFGRIAAEQDGVANLSMIPYRSACGASCPPGAAVLPYSNDGVPLPAPSVPAYPATIPPEPLPPATDDFSPVPYDAVPPAVSAEPLGGGEGSYFPVGPPEDVGSPAAESGFTDEEFGTASWLEGGKAGWGRSPVTSPTGSGAATSYGAAQERPAHPLWARATQSSYVRPVGY